MSPEIAQEILLKIAIQAAKAAGTHALENKHRRRESTESFAHDLKLVLDAECQKIAEEVILHAFPQHGILGEEEVRPAAPDEYEWIIDPIDGTMNYTHDFPYWCASVAVQRNGEVLAGCVFAPEFSDCYTATADGPACLNGEPIQCSALNDLERALVFTGISKYMHSNPEAHFSTFQRLALNTRKLRINGAAALDLCYLAAGVADGFFETTLYLWDHAAGGLIARKAGVKMKIVPLEIAPHACTVVAAAPAIFDSLRDLCLDYSEDDSTERA